MTLYIALLRGINVGGKNLIKMPDLLKSFQDLGFQNVSTYIQSGNIIFRSDETNQEKLTICIDEALSKTYNYESTVVLRSRAELEAIVAHAPEGFGSQPDTYRYDVIFLKKPLLAADLLQELSYKEGVDQAFAWDGVLYFIRLISRASESRLTRINAMPIYKSITVRNWNTTTKLHSLMQNSGD